MQSENKISIPEKIISLTDLFQKIPDAKMRDQLIALINELINRDFSSLIQLLYRIDVDEKKIRLYLKQTQHEDAAPVLADLIIERQLQKKERRKQSNKITPPESGEEKW